MKILIPIICVCIFIYFLVGYIIAMILVALDDNPCGPMRFGDGPDELMVGVVTALWPILCPMLIIWLLWELIKFIGNKIAIIPISIALAIKYVLEKEKEKEIEEDESNSAS